MASDTFKKLYESSKLLVSPPNREQYPIITRDWNHLRNETQNIFGRNKLNQEQKANGYHFLARHGVNSQDFTQKLDVLDTTYSFQPTDTLNDTDVEKYLQQSHERIIINTIEECRHNTCLDFEEKAERAMLAHWRNAQRQILEEWDHRQDNNAFGREDSSFKSLDMALPTADSFRQRVSAYAAIVGKLNDARVQKVDFPVIESFAQLLKSSDAEKAQNRAMDAWQLVDELCREHENGTGKRKEGYFLRSYLERSIDSPSEVQVRRLLIASCRGWLEKQFVQYADDVLLRHAMEAQVGGVPSPMHRLRAFMNFVFRKNLGWTDPRFEVVNDTPIWTFVYLLIRSGYSNLALQYVTENQQLFQTEPQFVRYFLEYMESPDRRLTKPTRDALLADYQRLEYGQQRVDPYKLVIYKILGRCELSKKTLPDVIATTEDYMWLQLTLVREDIEGDEYDYERYRLSDLQASINKYGSKRFDPNGSNPWIYFKVLLLTLQFERAVNYLYKNEKSRLEAVHFAVALAYYGLLRIPAEPTISSIDFLIVEDDDRISLNFPRLIYQYVRIFAATNPQDALNYMYLLTLYSDRRRDSDDMMSLCHSYVQDLVLTTKDCNVILGTLSPEQGRLPGLLDRHKELIGITSEQSYVQNILIPIAEKFSQENRYKEAVLVYELTTDYNRVIDVLNKQLGDALQQARDQRTAADPEQAQHNRASDEQMITFALETLKRYEKHQHIGMLIKESKKHAVQVLIQMLRCHSLYDEGLYEQALQLVQQSGLIPLEDDFGQVQRAADQFEQLDETVRKNVPDLLLMVADMLYKLYKTFTGVQLSMQPAAKQRIAKIDENIRAILAFVGIIQFKMPADTVAKLNRAEMVMRGK